MTAGESHIISIFFRVGEDGRPEAVDHVLQLQEAMQGGHQARYSCCCCCHRVVIVFVIAVVIVLSLLLSLLVLSLF